MKAYTPEEWATHAADVEALGRPACACGICGAPADKIKTGIFVCRDNGNHKADGVVGIWSDLTHPDVAP